MGLQFDEIGYWSELKLEIVKKYGQAYSTILARQPGLSHVYVDGFSGAGSHISRATGKFVKGSPLNALEIQPPFEEYFLIDLDGDKVNALRAAVGQQSNVHILHGDCNEVLSEQVFPRIRYREFRRGLCLLDPYGLHLNWEAFSAARRHKKVEHAAAVLRKLLLVAERRFRRLNSPELFEGGLRRSAVRRWSASAQRVGRRLMRLHTS